MNARLVIATGFTLLAATVATGQTPTIDGHGPSRTSNKWVERTKADVRAGKASFHPVVDTVLKGDQVTVLATEDKWLNVRTPRGKNGWMFEGALSAKAIERGGGSDFLKHVPGGDASTSATAASMGAKGLYAEQYAKNKGYDFSVVQRIEENQPTAQEIETFLRSGTGR